MKNNSNNSVLRKVYTLTLVSVLFTCFVITLGAYTRLTDAGLGCPDWPGCYGFLTVPNSDVELAKAEAAFPERPVEASKAWAEMIHRYFAGTLGLLILANFLLHLKAKLPIVLPALLLVTVTFQAVLGMLTVTMNLMPLVVMGHLLGGFLTFSLLLWLALSLRRKLSPNNVVLGAPKITSPTYLWLKLALAAVVLQIALGGWTAANYSAVACIQLPICESGWQEKFDLAQALSVPTGHSDYEYGVFPYEARMTIHILHRLGAMVVTGVVLLLLVQLFRSRRQNANHITLIGGLLALQIALGISNVIFHLPLYVAVAHNFVGLLLLNSLLVLAFNARISLAQNKISHSPEQLAQVSSQLQTGA